MISIEDEGKRNDALIEFAKTTSVLKNIYDIYFNEKTYREYAEKKKACENKRDGITNTGKLVDTLSLRVSGVAEAALRGVRLRPALSQGQAGDHRVVRALALPLCGRGGREVHDGQQRLSGRIDCDVLTPDGAAESGPD